MLTHPDCRWLQSAPLSRERGKAHRRWARGESVYYFNLFIFHSLFSTSLFSGLFGVIHLIVDSPHVPKRTFLLSRERGEKHIADERGASNGYNRKTYALIFSNAVEMSLTSSFLILKTFKLRLSRIFSRCSSSSF